MVSKVLPSHVLKKNPTMKMDVVENETKNFESTKDEREKTMNPQKSRD